MIPMTSSKKKCLRNILEHIGGTPTVVLNKIPQEEGIRCQVVAKCEFFNAGGSVKDRIAKRMIEEAEKDGRLKMEPTPTTIIEPTSGNTGIGLALAGAVKGYPVIITLPEKMSAEKVNVLKGLGAKVIRTPTEAAFDSPESHISVAKNINKEIKESIILDQYANPNNPLAHYEGTAVELWVACEGKLDLVVMGAGTGGTISGVAKKLKELNPSIIVVGVDPHGSILAGSTERDNVPYLVEGIGYDFIPNVLDLSLIDHWVRTDDKESFLMARRLIREEGLLCGGSSGSAMVGLVKAVRHYNLGPDKRAAVLLPDSVRNYLNKFLSDDWMLIKGFIDPENLVQKESDHWPGETAASLIFHDTKMVHKQQKIGRVQPHTFVLDNQDNPVGVVSVEKFYQKTLEGCSDFKEEPVTKIMSNDYGIISESLPLYLAIRYMQTAYPIAVRKSDGSIHLVNKAESFTKLLLYM